VQQVQRGASAFAAAAAGCRRSIDFRLKVTLNTVAGPFTFAGRLSLSLSLGAAPDLPQAGRLQPLVLSGASASPPARSCIFGTLARYAFSPLALAAPAPFLFSSHSPDWGKEKMGTSASPFKPVHLLSATALHKEIFKSGRPVPAGAVEFTYAFFFTLFLCQKFK
jgi:hypothetical protein